MDLLCGRLVSARHAAAERFFSVDPCAESSDLVGSMSYGPTRIGVGLPCGQLVSTGNDVARRSIRARRASRTTAVDGMYDDTARARLDVRGRRLVSAGCGARKCRRRGSGSSAQSA